MRLAVNLTPVAVKEAELFWQFTCLQFLHNCVTGRNMKLELTTNDVIEIMNVSYLYSFGHDNILKSKIM